MCQNSLTCGVKQFHMKISTWRRNILQTLGLLDFATHSSIAFDLYSLFYHNIYFHVFSLLYTCSFVVGLFCGAKTIIIDLFPSSFSVQIITGMVLTLRM